MIHLIKQDQSLTLQKPNLNIHRIQIISIRTMGLKAELSLQRWVRRTDLVNPTGKVQLGILMASSPDSEVAQHNLQGST